MKFTKKEINNNTKLQIMLNIYIGTIKGECPYFQNVPCIVWPII